MFGRIAPVLAVAASVGMLAVRCDHGVWLEGEPPGDAHRPDDTTTDARDDADVSEAADLPDVPIDSRTWVLRLGDTGWHEDLERVAVDGDGTLVAVGSRTPRDGTGDTEGWVVRLDPDGHVLEQYVLPGVWIRWLPNVVRTTTGELVVVGETTRWGAGHTDLWFGVLGTGEIRRQWTLGGPDDDRWPGVHPTADGGLVVAATLDETFGLPQLAVARLAPDGTLSWQQTFPLPDTDQVYGGLPVEDPSGRIYVASLLPREEVGDDVRLLALEADGALRWERVLGDTGHDGSTALRADATGLWLTGQTDNSPFTDCAGWLVQVGHDGNVLRQTAYQGGSCDATIDLVADGAGWVLAGNLGSRVTGVPPYRVWLLSVLADGSVSRELALTVGDRALPSAMVALGPDLVVVGEIEPRDGPGDDDSFVARASAALAPPAGCAAFAAVSTASAPTAVPMQDLASRVEPTSWTVGAAAVEPLDVEVPARWECGP